MAIDQAATDPSAADETPSDYQICISVTAGKISVGVESASAEAAEGGNEAGGEASEAMKPVGSIREAMSMAMEIYQNDGAMPDGSDDAEFNGGFGKQAAAPKDKMFNEE